jgi:hypothetical protein
MSEGIVRDDHVTMIASHPDWGAIWAGVFTFFAIWCVFGLLGMSLFSDVSGSRIGVSVGMGIWAVILTIVAMYVAGRATGHLAGVSTARDGLIHGVVMFGLSVMIALGVTALAGHSIDVNAATAVGARSPYLLGIFADLGWFGFLSLFFGWLAAMGGATASTHVFHTSSHQVSHAH